MIGKHYGKEHSLTFLRESSSLSRQGTSMSDLSDTAEKVGFKTMTVRIPLEILIKEQPFPCILHWKQNHFIVLYKAKNGVAFVADPAVGRLKYSLDEMRKHWALGDPEDNGIALLLEPVPTFYSNKYEQDGPKWGLSYFAKYLLPYKKLVIQLMFGLLAGSLLNLIIPFLTQSLVDIGVSKNNLSFVYLILIAQLMFFVGGTTITVIRSWVLLHISSRLNITIISDF